MFQVFIQPGTYSVHMVEGAGQGETEEATPLKLEWHVKERTYIVHSLWIHMTQAE